MSSVRNRILQFQQSSNNPTSNGSTTSTNSAISSFLKSSSSPSTILPFGRSGSNGSIPPDIVATTVTQANGSNSSNHLRGNNNQFLLGNTSLNNNNNCINNSSVSSSTSSLISTSANGGVGARSKSGSTFPHTNSQKNHSSSINNGYFGNSYGVNNTTGLKTTTPSVSTSTLSSSSSSTNLSRSQVNIRKYSGNFSPDSFSTSVSTNSLASTWRSGSSEKKSPILEPISTASIVRTVEIPLKSSKSEDHFSLTPPAVNRANKPALAMKKASMTINLSPSTLSSSSSSSPSPPGLSNGVTGTSNNHFHKPYNNMNGSHATANGGRSNTSSTLSSPTRPKARTPTRTSPTSSTSSIPKLNSNGSTGYGLGGVGTNAAPVTVRYRDPSPGRLGRRGSPGTLVSNRSSPATTPTGSNGGVAFGSTFNGSSSRFYQSIGWKEKFEESEKKRNHLVTLAQRGEYIFMYPVYKLIYASSEPFTATVRMNLFSFLGKVRSVTLVTFFFLFLPQQHETTKSWDDVIMSYIKIMKKWLLDLSQQVINWNPSELVRERKWLPGLSYHKCFFFHRISRSCYFVFALVRSFGGNLWRVSQVEETIRGREPREVWSPFESWWGNMR